MDITDEDMAKLVLGYLKSEKCKGAAKLFLKSSRYLQDVHGRIQTSKQFITHKHGYCLREILREYAKLYTIIIEYMEGICYPSHITTRDMPTKLIHLLETAKSRDSCTPSLSPRSRSSTPEKQISSPSYKSKRTNLSIIEENGPSCDVNTTPLHELPGHFSSNNSSSEGTKKKPMGKEDESDVTDNVEDNDEGSIAKVLAETFLENRELQEKLAENINSVIQKPSDENLVCNSSEHIVNVELNAAIKAIVRKTEHDPVFEKLLNDLIGPNENESETDNQTKTTENSPLKDHRDITNSTPSQENYTATHCNPSIPPTDPNLTPPRRQTITLEGTKVDMPVKQNLTVNTNTGEVILYGGTLENYMKEPTNSLSTTASVNSSCSSNVVLNSGLLMVQPPAVQPPQSYYVWNGSQIVNVGVPQYKVNNLSEQDILTMPTVIVCDENQQGNNETNVGEEVNRKILKKIAPKGDSPSVHIPKRKKRSYKKKTPKRNLKETSPTKSDRKIEMNVKVLPGKENVNEPSSILETVQAESGFQTKEIDVGRKEMSEKTPKELTPKAKSVKEDTSTPKSGSHVRALDFELGTPRSSCSLETNNKSNNKKPSMTSPKKRSPNSKSNPPKISKSLFSSPGKNQKKTKTADKLIEKKTSGAKKSWDADLRALAGSSMKSPSPKKEKSSNRKRIKSESLNKTEQDAKAIEDNLKAEDEANKEMSNENLQKIDDKKISIECTQIVIQRETKKTENKEKEGKKTENKQADIEEMETEDAEEDAEDTFTLINYNRAPRIKRKCNIDGNVKKVAKVTKVKEVKNLDVCNNKMILSPSKLNASKRTFVDHKTEDVERQSNHQEIENKSKNIKNLKEIENNWKQVDNKTKKIENKSKQTENKLDFKNKSKEIENNLKEIEQDFDGIEKSPENKMKEDKIPLTPSIYGNFQEHEILTLNFDKNLTPENKINYIPESNVVSATRNLLPLLETPLKQDAIAKVPRIVSPVSIKDTPLTKMFKEQLEGVDLTDIQTPQFPITPNLAVTPFNNERYVNRPTDYSTSSSYYQPSDAEQNKSLEQLIEDSKREKICPERKGISETDAVDENQKGIKEGNEQFKENDEEINNEIKEGGEKNPESQIFTSMVNKLNTFNKNIIGKKNLSLVSKAESISFADSESDFDFNENNESDESEESLWISKKNNVTVIQNVQNNANQRQNRYPLRSRNKETEKNKEENELLKEDKEVNLEINCNNKEIREENVLFKTEKEINVEQKGKITNSKDKILQELEKKRQETIAMIKQPNLETKQSTVKKSRKQTNAKIINKQSNVVDKQMDKSKQSKSLKLKSLKSQNLKSTKSIRKQEPKMTNKKDLLENSLSSNERNLNLNVVINPLNFVETHLENSNDDKTGKISESSQELNRECLIRDLKERGIYLLPKKVQLEPPDDNSSTELINQTSKISHFTENKSILPLKKRDSNKSFEIKEFNDKTKEIKDETKEIETKTKEFNDENKEINKSNAVNKGEYESLEDDLNLTDSFIENVPIFDTKLKEDVDFTFIHDPNEKTSKTLQDYDLKCLDKTYTANVFVDELNRDISRRLKVSPMDFIFDLNPISSKSSDSSKEKVKILEVVTLKKCSPLENLYTQLMKNNTSVIPIEKSKNPQTKSFLKDIQAKSPLEDVYKTEKSLLHPKNTRRKSLETGKKSASTTISARKSNRSESVDDKKTKSNFSNKKKSLDLMDFAIVGDKECSGTTSGSETGSKRKANDDIDSEKTKCPKMCENLLSRLNVDHFLAQIHKK